MITIEGINRTFEIEKQNAKDRKKLLDFIYWREPDIHPMDAGKLIDIYLSQNKQKMNATINGTNYHSDLKFDQEKGETSTEHAIDGNTVLPAVLICECSSREHQIIIEHDNEDNLTYCHIHLVNHGFWQRLKAGFKYIFGYKCKYGAWDSIIVSKQNYLPLKEAIEFLEYGG